MTREVYAFVKGLGLRGKCLDVGSFDVNGSVRYLFEDYTGMDMRAGPNVDVVHDACSLPFGNDTFDTVTCLEMLEHCKYPFIAVDEMVRVLKPGGVLVVTAPSIGFPEHNYPSDYWRFTTEAMKVLAEGLVDVNVVKDKDHVYLVARRSV